MENKRISFSVKGVVYREKSLLMMRRSHSDIWELPGGHLEFGETASEAMIREMREETGLQVETVKILDTWDSVKDNWHITGLIWLCSTENYDITLSDEHCEYRWVSPGDEDFELMHDVFRDKLRVLHSNICN